MFQNEPLSSLRTAAQCLTSVLTLAITLSAVSTAHAQKPPIVQRGDAVVTGFSGTTQPGPDLPPDVHPLDRTYLDVEGVTARIFDLTRLGGAPQGQLADAPVKFSLKARDIGHVFGIAFDGDGKDGTPNIYLTATSIHGLQLVMPNADGKPQRVMTGRPGAQWMNGLFGTAKGGGPGTVWKVNGATGEVSRFANITNGDLENSGAGLGSIAFDPRSRQLYVSDLETGLVWRLGLDGRAVDSYDHGSMGRESAGLPIAAYNPAYRTDRTVDSFNTEIPEIMGLHRSRAARLGARGRGPPALLLCRFGPDGLVRQPQRQWFVRY